MGTLLLASETAFAVVKILGAAYLIWLGLRILRSADRPAPGVASIERMSLRSIAKREFLIAMGNPKAVVVFTAFLPQFVDQERYWSSLFLIGTVYLGLELVAITIYAVSGARFVGALRSANGLLWINRVSGSIMILFGVFLAFSRRPTA